MERASSPPTRNIRLDSSSQYRWKEKGKPAGGGVTALRNSFSTVENNHKLTRSDVIELVLTFTEPLP